MKRALTVLLAAMLALMLGGCGLSFARRDGGPAVPEHVFRYAENQPLDYPTTQGALRFAQLVEERTGGRIKIVVYCDAQLGSEKSVIEQMQFGGIDFTRVSISTLAEVEDSLNVLQLPYLYRDDAHMWRVLDGEIGDDFLLAANDAGLVGLSWYDAGARSFYSRGQITCLEDLAGLNIRVQESNLMSGMVQALGANPVPMAFGEVYSALQTGAIDGAENNWPSYQSTAHYEVAHHFVRNEHARVPEMQLISQVTVDKLGEADLAIIRECARESALYERSVWTRREAEAMEEVVAGGAIVTALADKERRRFQEACEPLYEAFCGDYMDIVTRILAA